MDAASADWPRSYLEVLRRKASIELQAGDTAAAIKGVEQAAWIYASATVRPGSESLWLVEGARVSLQRGEVYRAKEPKLAEEYLRKAQALFTRLLKSNPKNVDAETKRDLVKLDNLLNAAGG